MKQETVKITTAQFDAIKKALNKARRELYACKDEPITIKTFEIAFQEAIESAMPEGVCWWEITTVRIFEHLMLHRDPAKTIKAILYNLEVKQ